MELNYDCSICRSKIDNLTIELKNYEDIFDKKKWYYVGDNHKTVIQNIINNKRPCVLYFEDKNYLNYYKSILEIIPHKNKIYLFLNNIEELIESEDKYLNLFYFKNKTKMKNTDKKIVMIIKKNFKNVSIYNININ